MKQTKLLIFICLVAAGCSQLSRSEINNVLNARNTAITARDIAAYSDLIAPNYQDHGSGKTEVVARMTRMFERFDALDMRTINRDIYLVDGDHAECTQSYRLRAYVDDRWRTMLQREELSLERTHAGWKISAGL